MEHFSKDVMLLLPNMFIIRAVAVIHQNKIRRFIDLFDIFHLAPLLMAMATYDITPENHFVHDQNRKSHFSLRDSQAF